MLKHTTSKTINIPTGECTKCLLDPEGILGVSRYTYTIKHLEDHTYQVVFKWVKMGITRFYRVTFKVRQGNNSIVYESTGNSDYWMKLEFKLEPLDKATRIRITALMRAGILASLLGKKDYAEFIEELVETGIRRSLNKITSRANRKTVTIQQAQGNGRISCKGCLLYDPDRRYCYRMVKAVDDCECQGRYYIDKKLILKEAEML